ncbi:hypothetical protein K6959_04230 [Bacillus aquiflavi]|uniref:hypothetical protein n=1 Tax=Bacillus aquiflavi TaxID=2672567 RepID=UPI001CAA19E5|nr:hypothetical protein [Bacillus aquiflavi]UAC49111.1 hypothetical protein K6959_04230 [Bacillus aquiflavi]
MQIFLAYQLFKNISEEEINKRILNIENYFFHHFNKKNLIKGYSSLDHIGLIFWQPTLKHYSFPAWKENGDRSICTIYAPSGWEQIVKHKNEATAPFQLVEVLNRNPARFNQFTPPLIFSYLDKKRQELKIFNDGLGMAKLYCLKTDSGYFFSNKVSALYLFAKERAVMDKRGWHIFAQAGWFMGNSSSIKGSYRVQPGRSIILKNNQTTQIKNLNLNSLDAWVNPRKREEQPFSEHVESILTTTKSFFNMFDYPVTSMLSGGKDSRVTSAMMIKSGIDCSFRTIGPLKQEMEIAKLLLRRINLQDRHHIIEKKDQNHKQNPIPLAERLSMLHVVFDGDYTPVKQTGMITKASIYRLSNVLIGGTGGEIAIGKYYSNPEMRKKIIAKGSVGPEWRLLSSLSLDQAEACHDIKAEVRQVINEALQLGLKGLEILDYFFLKERVGRWDPKGGHFNSFTPFTTPSFITLAFKQTPLEKANFTLHKKLIHYLIPKWSTIPFYKADIKKEKRDEKAEKKMRIWQNNDRHFVDEILYSTQLWKEFFDKKKVLHFWQTAKKKGLFPRYEALFQRIVWLASFKQHLSSLNQHIK